MALPGGSYDVHVDGSFTVLVRPDGQYEAHVRIAGSSNLLVGTAYRPNTAVARAMGLEPAPQTLPLED